MLKVLFPLGALGVLAAVFFWQQDQDLGGGLTFSDADLRAMRTGLKLTQPQFSGTSLAGDVYDFKARTVVPRDLELSMAEIEALDGRVEYADGRIVELVAETAEVDIAARLIAMQDGVVITTSDGYRATADRLDVDVSAAILNATGSVVATGPMGRITADALVIEPADGAAQPEHANETLIRFVGKVELVFVPGVE